MMQSLLCGFGIGLSLLVVIGAQNAFVLRQGLHKQHVFLVCAICAFSDALLIAAGGIGFSWVLSQSPWVITYARYGGIIFLIAYGSKSLWRSVYTNKTLTVEKEALQKRWLVVFTALALTWLNPHVYLDTLVLLGLLTHQFPSPWLFSIGAVSASCVFFFALGYGARFLRWLFVKPLSWRCFDMLIGIFMLYQAYRIYISA